MHVGPVDKATSWSTGGTGERMLAATTDRLLETRLTVLDVGSVVLGGPLLDDHLHAAPGHVFDFGARLWAVHRGALPSRPALLGTGDQAARFGISPSRPGRLRLRPLLSSAPGARPELVAEALGLRPWSTRAGAGGRGRGRAAVAAPAGRAGDHRRR